MKENTLYLLVSGSALDFSNEIVFVYHKNSKYLYKKIIMIRGKKDLELLFQLVIYLII